MFRYKHNYRISSGWYFWPGSVIEKIYYQLFVAVE